RPIALRGGETLSLAGMEIRVLHTPGHSAGSVCYLLPDGQGVLTGDTLFAHGYGRTDFADGSFHELKESLRALFHLTPRQVAYPGHEEAGTVGRDPVEG
ncbi:MAG: MBL fold metallo-hydrolase, partial [Clostridiales bacterium]|nr:MBL fold metallo-hydrolase [Clostridiales bacterium]